jgi:heme/copper-type cytochrome/quinol oxidase subunit 3
LPRSHASLRVITDPRPPPAIPSPVLGMLFFVITEAMLFAGLISAFLIVKATSAGAWPPISLTRSQCAMCSSVIL